MKKIGFLQITMLILSSVGLVNHVFIIPVLLDRSGRDAWLAIIAVVVPYLLWCGLLSFIMKKSGQQPIMAWIRNQYGRFASVTLALFAIVYLFCSAVITMEDTVTWAITSYLPSTPKFILLLFLAAVCYATSIQGLRVLAILAGILIPGVVVLGFFVSTSNIPNKDYSRLFPILEHGWGPVWHGALVCSSGLVELTILLFMQQYLTRPVPYWHLALVGLMLIGLTLGPTMGGIAEFGTIEMIKLRYPAFEEWKLVILAKNVERLDFLSIYQWMAGAYLRISTAIFLIHELFNHRKKIPIAIFLLPFYFLLMAAVILPLSDVNYYYVISHVYLPGTLILLGSFTVVLGMLAWRSKSRRESVV